MRFFQLWASIWLIAWQDLHLSLCLRVRFPDKKSLYIALDKTLVLTAQIQLEPSETILLRTWERSNKLGDIRVAENDIMKNNRTFMEDNGAVLRILNVTESDLGTYKVTITTLTGHLASDSRTVIKLTNPPSTSLSMQCNVLSEGAQWDTPVFSWTVDGVHQPNVTGPILPLTSLGQNYTCTTESSQGTGRVEVHMREPTPCSCVIWIVAAVIEFILICFGIGVYLYQRKNNQEIARSRDTI